MTSDLSSLACPHLFSLFSSHARPYPAHPQSGSVPLDPCESFPYGSTIDFTVTTDGGGASGSGSGGGGLSGGSILLIIVLVLSVVYLAGGCYYNRKRKGTTVRTSPSPSRNIFAPLMYVGVCFFSPTASLPSGNGGKLPEPRILVSPPRAHEGWLYLHQQQVSQAHLGQDHQLLFPKHSGL